MFRTGVEGMGMGAECDFTGCWCRRVDQADWQLLQHPRHKPLRRNKHQYVLPLLQLLLFRCQCELKLGFLVLFFVELDEWGDPEYLG